MKAAVFEGIETVTVANVPDPTIEVASDAVVRVVSAGLCGSDLHVYHGRESGLDHGTIMGHEMVGEVVALGPEVEMLSIGDLVVSPFTTSCGACSYCRKGLTARCLKGQLFGWRQDDVGLHGMQAEFVRVPMADTTLVRVPEGVEVESALLAGDVLATGYFCAEQGGVSAGATVAVVGCGPVGLMAILAANRLGAERVLAVDWVPERLELAARFGAEPVNFHDASALATITLADDGPAADVVLEAVGNESASLTALELVRPGGTISIVGVHTESHFAFSPTAAYDKNLTIKIGRCPARYYLDSLLLWLARASPPVTDIISHRLPLEDTTRAYKIFAEKLDHCTKVVLHP